MSKYFQELLWYVSLKHKLYVEAPNKIIARNIQISFFNLNHSLYYIKSWDVEEMVDKNGF